MIYPSKTSFSFIEMLVALSVFALLASLLQPSFKKMMIAAHSVECQNQLKIMFMAMNQIREESDDLWPVGGHYNYFTRRWRSELFWVNQVVAQDPDIEKNKLHFCPAEDWHHGLGDYGPNEYIVVQSRANNADDLIQNQKRVGLKDMRTPGEKVLLIDSRRGINGGGSWMFGARRWVNNPVFGSNSSPTPPRHGNGSNGVFCDGHTENIDIATLTHHRKQLFEFYK